MITKNYLIVGNPVEHSLSPKIHNHWFKMNNLKSFYKKELANENELENLTTRIKKGHLDGANITVPFKQKIIPYLDGLSKLAEKTQSVNTLYKKGDLVVGDNTDVYGFSQSIKENKVDLKNKIALIIGAGGVVPSIISALEALFISKIYIKNRTYENILTIKKKFNNLIPLKWDQEIECDIVINATSLGLNSEDKIEINFNMMDKQTIFYDTIYNPPMTNFLKLAENKGHKTINGKLMLLFQAQKAFNIWTGFTPEIDNNLINILND